MRLLYKEAVRLPQKPETAEGGREMSDHTQLNRDLNATVLNSQAAAEFCDSTVLNLQAGGQGVQMLGEVIEGKYTVQTRLNISTGEADLYICSDGTDQYVAKVYRRKVAIKEEVTEKLKAIDSPYVAKVYATGEIKSFPYEIIPYYKNGSLQGRTFTYEQLKNGVIPALNEGLRVLHENGIIHKDLKPSNIMLADNGRDVVIIDFGISSIREDGNTIVVTRTGMTPEYSAPETFKNLFLSESDYYSLGVTLYELYCGHTPYARMTPDEIEQFVSVQKLPLPAEMDDELKVLISALTYPDITNRKNKLNPNRRWGYEEILKWCVGIKQPVPGEMTGEAVMNGDIRPYKFLGETYTDKKKLLKALTDHWEEGKKQLFRGLLSAYFKGFDAETAGFCLDAEAEADGGDEDIIFFKTLYKIDPAMITFLWKGKQYKDVAELGNEFLETLWKKDPSMNSFVDELLEKGVLSQYVLCMSDEDTQKVSALKALESSHRAFADDSRQKSLNYYLLAYMLSGRKAFRIRGTEFSSIKELMYSLKAALEKSYEDFEKLCHELIDIKGRLDPQFEGWLLALGKKEELEQWRA